MKTHFSIILICVVLGACKQGTSSAIDSKEKMKGDQTENKFPNSLDPNSIMTKELTKDQFKSTTGKLSMVDVTETAEPVVDIWPYIEQLKNDNVVSPYVFEKELVEKVYRNSENTFDHILLPTKDQNRFIVIVVDLNYKQISGHYNLDLNKEYGIE